MKKIFFTFLILLEVSFISNSSLAHNFFVNITESMTHPPGSIISNIGWGHALPMDDFFQGNTLLSYSVYDPVLKKMDFPFDSKANYGAEGDKGTEYSDFLGGKILTGDMYCRKVRFNKDAPQGTYQVAAITNKIQFSVWKDAKGRQKWGRITLDQIKNAKIIEACIQYQSFAKSFVNVGKWTEPKPLGHDLELIPLTDLSQVRVGDEVTFKVLLLGKPVQPDKKGQPNLKAYGECYGTNGAYGLRGIISNGIAKIRVTAPGRWLATVNVTKPVNKENGPEELIGKALTTGYNASATFFVRP